MANGVAFEERTAEYKGDGFRGDCEFETQILDQFEATQVFNFECETQVVDFEDGLEDVQTQALDQFEETQLVNLECETQVVDFEEGLENVQTQGLDQFEETQLVNFECETQVVDFEEGLENVQTQVLDQFEETQFVNLECDTQVVEFEEGLENVQTQVFDQFQVVADNCGEDENEDEGQSTSGSETEVLRLSSDELSDENTSGKRRNVLCDEQETGDNLNSMSAEKRERSYISDGGPSITGSVKRGFTSVRSASMRSSGLAARILNMRDNSSSSVPSNEHSPDKVENASLQEEDNCHAGHTNLNGMKCKVGSSAVRKLFSELEDLDSKRNSPDEIPEWKNAHLGDALPSGFSYVDSQEPGDLSQEKALEFVDKFLKDNVKESPVKIRTSMTSREKPLLVSSIKGQHILAKNVNTATPRETLVFSWDDSREDEGGGDLFCRRKEEFFHGESIQKLSMTDPIKLKRGTLSEAGDKAKPSTVPRKRNRISNFNLRTKLSLDRGSDKTKTSKKDIESQCSKHFDADSSGGHLEPAVDDVMTVYDLPEVGPDTQLAAEAMEELWTGEVLIDNSCNDGSQNFPRNVKKRGENWTSDYLVPGTTGHSVDECSLAKTSISHKKRPKKLKGAIKSDRLREIGLDTGVRKAADKGCLDLLTGNCVLLSTAKRTRSSVAAEEAVRAVSPRNILKKDTCVSGESVPKRKRTARIGNKNQLRVDACKGVQKKGSYELVSDECDELRNAKISATSAGSVDASAALVGSPGIISKGCLPANVTPENIAKPPKSVSPLCAGDEYLKQSCRKDLCKSSLMKEIRSLTSSTLDASPECKSLRRRRDMMDVSVLFSQHLDDDTVKHQKKILARLGASTASCMAEASHFVADEFVRTRNMLEAIASAKPVVTHLWLESCGQACCFLDEKNYILRDSKKEKQFGFSLPSTLARASQRPLLQGKKVLITPNTKPGKDTISNLVKTVRGQPTERIGRSGLKDGQVPDDLLILSCDEDYNICLPFLEKGAPIYSSELLLNGIVTQKLEYERHRLFADHIRRTRSTTWVRKGGKNFVPLVKM